MVYRKCRRLRKPTTTLINNAKGDYKTMGDHIEKLLDSQIPSFEMVGHLISTPSEISDTFKANGLHDIQAKLLKISAPAFQRVCVSFYFFL